MKFAREFKETLEKEGFPARWVELAIPYGQLKKCLKKVQSELVSLGLDPAILAQLSHQSDAQEAANLANGVAFKYHFDKEKAFHPKLTLFLHVDNGLAVDAVLSPDTRKYLEELARKQPQNPPSETRPESPEDPESPEREKSLMQWPSSEGTAGLENGGNDMLVIKTLEVPLIFDAEFFEILHSDVSELDSLQVEQQKALTDDIAVLSSDVTELVKPSKFAKSDMYRWRELFELYLEANIFFSTHELDHGRRTSEVATRQLQWFQSEVMKRNLVDSFKLPASRQALNRFITINLTLLKNLRFQEINQKAISKILKKFDKRTQLGAGRAFPELIKSDAIMSSSMAKAVCSQVSQDLIKTVPQLDDFLCPICFAIVWRPIRMKCKHIICIRCTVLLQRQKKRMCPLCRESVILEADEDNIDEELGKFLKKYFPKEVKEKQIAHEIADGIERFGVQYRHPSQSKCPVM